MAKIKIRFIITLIFILSVVFCADAATKANLKYDNISVKKTEQKGFKTVWAIAVSDGRVFNVESPNFIIWKSNNYYHYYDDFSVDYLPLYDFIQMKIPLREIRELKVVSSEKVKISLINGLEYSGKASDITSFTDKDVMEIVGIIKIAGYPAEIKIQMEEIDIILFKRDNAGHLEADVTKKDGNIKNGIGNFKVILHGGDTKRAVINSTELEFLLGDDWDPKERTVLKIPLNDILSMQRIKTEYDWQTKYLIELKNKEKLIGFVQQSSIQGTSQHQNQKLYFRAYFENLKSIEIAQSKEN